MRRASAPSLTDGAHAEPRKAPPKRPESFPRALERRAEPHASCVVHARLLTRERLTPSVVVRLPALAPPRDGALPPPLEWEATVACLARGSPEQQLAAGASQALRSRAH